MHEDVSPFPEEHSFQGCGGEEIIRSLKLLALINQSDNSPVKIEPHNKLHFPAVLKNIGLG